MAIDPFHVLAKAIKKARKRPRFAKIVSLDYDEGADVLYARFTHGKITDTEPLDADGMVMASLDVKERIIGLMILHASSFA